MGDRIILGPMDPPIQLRGDDRLVDTYVAQMGSEYGRVLFRHGPMVEIGGSTDVEHYVVITGCVFDGMGRLHAALEGRDG